MQNKKLMVQNKLGLHARAAAKLVNTASQFICDIIIKKANATINAKSIMAVMMLAATKGSTLEFIFDGEDEKLAANTIETLLNNRFDEEQ